MWMCTNDMIKCKNNVQCVPVEATCDGNTNCLDGSDEENCANFTCLPGGTKCADNLQCISEWMVCDNSFHCKDGSDELCEAPCLKTAITKPTIIRRCHENSERCVPIDKYCDRISDCPDGSDEVQCSCDDWNMIECRMGKADLCIYKEWLEKDNGTCDEMIETDKTEWGGASSDFHDTCVMISPEGEDEPHCIHPSSKHGCQSLSYPLKFGMQKFCISGNLEGKNKPVSLGNQNISYSIEYVTVIGITEVSALKGYEFLMDSNPAYQIQLVTLVNVTIIDSVFYVGGGDLVIKGSNLRNILITEPSHSTDHK